MAEYITKDAVISLFEKWSDGYAYIEIQVQDAIRQVSAIPHADVRPVVRGHWVPMDDYPHEDWECDVCGACLCGDESIPQDLNYCPNCGAWMKGGDAEWESTSSTTPE